MDPNKFSFSKKPICFPKRTSVISANMGSRDSPENNYTTRPSERTFSEEILEGEIATDDPLLDYDEQIRAPKFQSKKSLDCIGNAIEGFSRRSSPSPSPRTRIDDEPSQRVYQPALVELPSHSYDAIPEPSTSMNYTLSQITPLNVISNLQHDTSDPPSKKNSDDSISQLNRKSPNFSMAPIRPISGPRTPNYVPCVLRPIEKTTKADEEYTNMFDTQSTLESDSNLSRNHWKPNSSTMECMDCHRSFSLMNRRHHCRKCGDLFCSPCLLSKAKLDFRCRFDVNGILTKVCFQCGKLWSGYLVESFKVEVMPDFKGTETSKQGEERLVNGREANVPADWSWSSF
jgi:hypothetical protein